MTPLRQAATAVARGRATGFLRPVVLATLALLVPGLAGGAWAAVQLSATKVVTDDNGGSPRPGEVLTYTITVTNGGTTAAANVLLSDPVAASLTYLPGTLTSDDPTDVIVEGNPLQVQIGALAALGGGDNNVVITFKAQISAGATNGQVIGNQATITATGPITIVSDDPSTGAANDATNITVVNPLNITLTKTRDVATQTPGGNIVYTLSYNNAGSVSATNVSLADFVPSNTTFVSATGGGTLSGNLVTWNIGTIVAGGSGSRQFTVSVNTGVAAGVIISNSGSISFQDDLGNTQDPKTSNTVTTTVTQVAAVLVDPDQSGSIRPANGTSYTYTFTVTNTGNGTDRFDLTDVLVQSQFSVSVELLSATGTVLATDNSSADGTWNSVLAAADTDGDGLPDTGNLAPGATVVYQVRITKPGGGGNNQTDIYRIRATSNFNPAVSDTATFTTIVSPSTTSVTISKSDSPDPVAAGSNITYTITVTNNGTQGLTGVSVSDVVPANTTFVSASAPGANSGGTVTWAIGNLAAAASQSLTLVVSVGAGVLNGTVISNTASVVSNETGLGTPVQATATTTVQSPVSFATSTKAVNFAAATPGSTLTYSISVINAGVSAATGVVVNDTIPPNTTYVAGSITGPGANAAGNPNLVWNVGNVAAGATVNLTYQVLVNNPVPAGTTSVTNTASIVSNQTAAVNTTTATTNLTAAPNFTISTKSVSDLNGGLVTTGDVLRYTVVVRNSGNMSATGVVVNDTVPANTTYVAGSITGTGADASGNPNLVWNVGPLNGAGATTTLTFDVTIGDAVAGGTAIANVASIASAQTASVNTNTATVTVQAGFSGTLTSTTPINPGNAVTLTLTDRNLNTNPVTVQTVNLTTVNSVTGESETRTYTETGANTGIFTASVATVFGLAAGTNNDGTFNVKAGDTLVTTYNDALTATGGAATVTATTTVVSAGVSGTIGATATILPTQAITITVTDSDLNTNPATTQTTTVTVNNPTTGESETVTLTETGVNTGIFSGTLSTSEGSVPDPTVGVLAVAKDDVVTSTYNDAISNNGGPATVTATTTVVKPVLTISKTDAPDPVTAGNNITYTLSYANTGTATATSTAITDTVPANTSFVSATGGGTVAGGVVTWNLGSVGAGASGTVQLVVQVASPLANGTVITNATYGIDSAETTPVAGAAVTTTVSSAPILSISKTDAPDPVPAGNNITYTINYSNTGNMNASAVVITDTVPVNTTFVSATGGGTLGGGVVTWNIGALNAGSSGSVQLVVQVNSPLPNGTIITNGTYGIDSAETAPASGAAVTTTVTSDPILNISKTDAPDPAVAGTDNITYTISYSNTGTANATNVVITDTVPAGTTFVSATGGGTQAGGVVTWNIGGLVAGGSGSVQMVVSINIPVANGTIITNSTYSIDSSEAPPATSGAAVTTTVLSDPRFTLTKTDGPDPVAAGANITYTLSYQNVGTNNATSVVLSDPLPANTTFVSATGGGTLAGGVVTWNLGTVNAGVSGSRQLVVQVNSPLANGTVITNTGWTIDSAEALPQTGPDVTTTVTAAPVLNISKTDAPDPVTAGSNITYTISYSNTGNMNASGVVLQDNVPGNTTFVSATGGGTQAGGVVTWNIGALNASVSGSVQMVVQVVSPLPNGTIITNGTYQIDSNETAATAGAAVTTTVDSLPTLSVSKTDAPDPVAAGANVTYTISYSNTGSATATSVAITDAVPANTTFVSATGGGTLAAGVVTWNLGNLAPGASGSVTLTVQAASPLANGTVITNGTYAIDCAETAPVSGAAVTTTVTSAPILSVSKTDAPDPVAAGANITYTINYSNTGNENASNVVLTDTIPANTSFVSATGGGTLAAGVVTWNIGAVNAGASSSRQLVVQVTSPLPNGTVITNGTYGIDSTETAPVSGAAITTTVSSAPVLTISKTDAPDPVNAGSNLTYTINYSNTGNMNATNVVVTDTVPANTTFVSATGGGTLAGGVVTWNIGALNAGASGSVQMVVQVTSPLANGTIITNGTYDIDCTETAPVSGASVTTTVSSSPVLNISKTDAPDPVAAGANITYTISYSNTGNANATGVVIADTVPANTTFVSATGGGTLGGGVVTWNIGNLAAGASASVQLIVQVTSPLANGTIITNGTYSIDSAQTAPTSGAAVTTTVTSAPVLGVSKTDAPDPVAAGANITYTINYSNTGNANATGVVITDTVPANTTFVSATGGGTLGGGVVTWNLGILAAGGSGSVQMVVQVASPLANGTVISNGTYGIDSAETAPVAGAAVTTTVTSAPVLNISKTDSPDPIPAGNNITYTISYSNTGNMNGSGVVIADTVPANTTFVSATGGGTLAAGVVTWNIGALAAGASGSVQLVVQVTSPLPNGTIIANGTYSIDSVETAPTSGAAVQTTVTSDPILNIGKTDSPDPAVAGVDNITYTLSYSNTGNSNATNVVITDTVPAGTTFVSATGGGTQAGGVVTWNIGGLASGGSGLVQVVVSINTPVANGTVITNSTYGIDCTETAPVSGAAAGTTVTSSVNFILTKTDAPDPVAAGGNITYTLSYQNTGTQNATGVVVADPLPANTAFVSATGGGALAGGIVTWNIGGVAAGASGSVQLVVQVASPLANGTVITNSGWTLDSNEILPQSGPNATTTVTSAPVLNISKTDAPDPVTAGGNIAYTVSYSNAGNMNATGVVLTDAVPANTSFVSATGGGALAGGVVTWNVGALNAGASGSVQMVVQVNSPLANGTVITNGSYQIDSNETSPTAGAAVTTTVSSAPVLNVSKGDAPDPVNAGSSITYTITYSNTGTADATGTTITDTVPANTTFVSATGGGSLAGGVVTWNLGLLSAGASGSVQLVVQVVTPLANGTVITNGAYAIDSSETAPTAGAAVTTTVNSIPVLSVTKSGAPDPVAAGANLTYTIGYTNSGTANATGTVISDTVPANTAFVSATGGGTLAAGMVTWNIGALAAGASGSVQLVVQLASPLPNGSFVNNTAYSIDSNETTPVAGVPTSNTVTSSPSLGATKTVTDLNGGSLNSGDTLAYTITVTNSGNGTATNTFLSDAIPANTTLVAGSLTSDDATDVRTEGNPLTVAIGDLGPDPDVVVTFRVVIANGVANGTVIGNQATITADGPLALVSDDPSTGAANDPTDITVTAVAAPVVLQSVADLNGGSLNPGDILVYTTTVTNTGSADATAVVVTDTVPASTTYVAASITGPGANDAGNPNLAWNVGTVAAGASVTLTFRVTVDAATPGGTVVSNQASLSAAGPISRLSDDPAANDGAETGNDPLDPADDDPTLTQAVYLGDVLQVAIAADALVVRRGDFVLYTISITNPTLLPVAGVDLLLTVPVGMSLVPGTMALDAVAQADPAPAIPVRIPIGVVNAGATRTLTYRAVVTTGAPIGDLATRARAVDPTSLPLSQEADHALPVIEDPEFDLGTIVGKVFDDKDGNGVQGLGERGVGGVMVAMEDGVYSVTDANGLYHIAAVRPGNRLVKINRHTLAPNDGLTLPEAQTVTLTPGLLTKVNFGVKMKPPLTIKQGRPGTYGIAVASEKVEAQAEVIGNLEDMTAVVNGVQARLPKARAKMDVFSLERNLRIVNGALEKPAVFQVSYPADRSLKEWTFEIFDSGMRRVRGFRGSDLKTTEIVWDGKDANGRLVQPGSIYQYQFTIEFKDGSLSKSPLRMFGVNRTNAISFELTGANFDTNTARLNASAGPILERIVGTLRQHPDEKIVVRGHTDSTGGADWNRRLSLMRAEAVRDYLVSSGIDPQQLVVEGRGAADPVAPNSTAAGRARNRRVEVKALLQETERARTFAAGPAAGEKAVVVNGQTVPTEEDGSFHAVVDPIKDRGRVYVGIRTDDGGVAATTVTLPTISIREPTTDVKVEIGKREDVIKLMQPTVTKEGLQYPTVKIPVRGRTEPGNQVFIDGEAVEVSSDGGFKTELPLAVGENTFGVVAMAPNGYTSLVNLAVNLTGVDKQRDLITVRKPMPQFTIELPPRGAVLSSPNLFVRGTAPKNALVTINKWRLPVGANGTFAGTVRLPEGPSVIDVTVTLMTGGEGRVGVPVSVRSDYLFLVALGDATINKVSTEGRVPEKYEDDLYVDGRVALYLKGRIQGKYLITAGLDTGDGRLSDLGSRLGDRNNASFTRNLDPDAFYPVYGDASRTVRDTNSQGRFYVLFEAPTGTFQWGNYNSGLTGNEYASFNRSLYGGKGTWRSLTKRKNGEPMGQALVFAALPETRSAHDEFLGTGGSLYFLRNKEVVQGSEKIRLEVRDKITGIPVANVTRRNYVDYEIDYAEGRILFRTPVSSVADTSTLISDGMLNGNPVVVVVDYEFNDASAPAVDDTTYGARVKQGLGENLTVGATYVQEERPTGTYTLQGADVTVRAGQDTQITAEVAQSEDQALAQWFSTDGGLSFQPKSVPSPGEPAQAYRFEFATGKGATRVTGYLRHVDAGFSSSYAVGQNESDQVGATFGLKLGKSAFVNVLLDSIEVIGVSTTNTGTLQYRQTWGKFGVTAEARYRDADRVIPGGDTTEGIGALRFDYRPTARLDLYVRHQDDFLQELNGASATTGTKRQTALGFEAQISPKVSARAELISAEQGDGVLAGVTTKIDERTALYGTYTLSPDQSGTMTGLLTMGATTAVGDRTRLYTEEQFKSNERETTTTNVVGMNTRLSDRVTTSLALERTRLDGTGTNPDTLRQTGSASLSYAHAWVKIFSKFELRHDEAPSPGLPAPPVDRDQWLSSNAVELKLSRDLTFLGRYNYGVTTDKLTDTNSSIFHEQSFGIAYRPVSIDWVNFLVRYTLVRNLPPDSQTLVPEETHDQVFSFQTVVDLHRRVSLTEKYAVRDRQIDQALLSDLKSRMKLWINRFNYHLSDRWDAALEYRTLAMDQAGDNGTDGFLFEVNRLFWGHLRVGVGYNFTDFTDNEFSANDYSAKGVFFRIQGKY
jgi:uncharacterized repeat protein (TIGR01451 family)